MSDSTELAEVSSILKACDFCGLVTLDVSLSSTQFGGIDDERSRFAHLPNCGCRVVRLQIDAPARVFNHGGPNA